MAQLIKITLIFLAFLLLLLFYTRHTNNLKDRQEEEKQIAAQRLITFRADSALYWTIKQIQKEVGQSFEGTAFIGDARGSVRILLFEGLDTALINARVSVNVAFTQYGDNYTVREKTAKEDYAFVYYQMCRPLDIGYDEEFTQRIYPVVFKYQASGWGNYGKNSNAYFGIDTVKSTLFCIISNEAFSYYGYIPLNSAQMAKAKQQFKEVAINFYGLDQRILTHGYIMDRRGDVLFYKTYSKAYILMAPNTDSLHPDYIQKAAQWFEDVEFYSKGVINNAGNRYERIDIYKDSKLIARDCYIHSDSLSDMQRSDEFLYEGDT
jgi:hypothetical protein